MKQESRSKKSLFNFTWGIMFRIINMLFPFAIKTMIIWKLGIQYLGLNSLFTSILSVLSLSELGIGSALVYSMYKPLAEGNKEKVSAFLYAYKKFYGIIGGVVFVLGMLLMPFIKNFINGSYPTEVNIYLLYFIYLCNTVLSYTFFAYKGSLLEASQNNGIESILHSVSNILMYLGQILVLLFTSNYYIYLLILPLTTLLLNIMRSRYVDRAFPEYICDCNNRLENSEIKQIFKKVKALIGHKIGTTVIISMDSIVISSFLGLNILAIYENYYMIVNSLIGLITIFYTAITASVGNSLVIETKEKISLHFSTLNFLNQWIVSWCTVCLFILYQPFMKLWMGKDMLYPVSTVVLFCVCFYSRLVRRIGLTYKDAAGMWEEDFWKPYIGMVVNIFGNIILVSVMGVNGVIISTIFVMVFIYFPWETYILGRRMFNNELMRKYVYKIVLNIIITVIICIVMHKMCSLIRNDNWSGLIFKSFLCLTVPNMFYLMCFWRRWEFKDSLKRLKKIFIGRIYEK